MDAGSALAVLAFFLFAVLLKPVFQSARGVERTDRFVLAALLLALAAESIQAAQLYKVYAFFGFTRGEIGILFLSGHISGTVFGPIVSSLADKFGRRKLSLACCGMLVGTFASNLSSGFQAQVIGRGVNSICVALLYSAFEAHLFHSGGEETHEPRLSVLAALLSMISSACVLIASPVADFSSMYFGTLAPPQLAAMLAALAGGVVWRWNESVGDKESPPFGSLAMGWIAMTSSAHIWLLGFAQICFEMSWAVFSFFWGPALRDSLDGDLPHTVLTTTFALFSLVGAQVYLFLASQRQFRVSAMLRNSAAVAAMCVLLTVMTNRPTPMMVAFCLLQVCYGVFSSCCAFLRSKWIPNDVRATVSAFFRAPVQAALVYALLNLSLMSQQKVAVALFVLLSSAALAGAVLVRLDKASSPNKELV